MPTIYIKDYDTEVTIPEGADMSKVQEALKTQFPPKKTGPVSSAIETAKYDLGIGYDKPSQPLPEFGAKDVAPMVLGVLGGLGGLASPIPGGTALGSVLGYAGGKNFNRAIGLDEQSSLPETARRTVMQDIPEGMLAEVVGVGAGKVLSKAAEKGVGYSSKLYESALKPSTTLKRDVVERRISTALRNEIPVSEKGLEKSNAIAKNINSQITEKINSVTGIDLTRMVDRDAALRNVANLSEKIYAGDITPRSEMVKIANYVSDIQATRPELLTMPEAQRFKQTINKQLNDYYSAVNKGKAVPGSVVMKTKAAMADGLREQMTIVFPELRSLNASEASLIELNKSLGQAVNRIHNREIIPLLSGIALGTSTSNGVAKALLLKAVEHPSVKSKLAIALFKANPKAYGSVGMLGGKLATMAGISESNANGGNE